MKFSVFSCKFLPVLQIPCHKAHYKNLRQNLKTQKVISLLMLEQSAKLLTILHFSSFATILCLSPVFAANFCTITILQPITRHGIQYFVGFF